MKEGRKEGRKEGKKEGRKEDRKQESKKEVVYEQIKHIFTCMYSYWRNEAVYYNVTTFS